MSDLIRFLDTPVVTWTSFLCGVALVGVSVFNLRRAQGPRAFAIFGLLFFGVGTLMSLAKLIGMW